MSNTVNKSRQDWGRGLALVLFTVLVSCSTPDMQNGESTEASLPTPVSDAPLLAEGEASDAAVFSDLQSEGSDKNNSDALPVVSGDPSASASEPLATDASLDSYYDALGGETLGRVAFTVYGSKKKVHTLLSMNSSLEGGQKLESGQKVFFSLSDAKPVSHYLTKGLVERYSDELSRRVEEVHQADGAPKKVVVIEKGDTLQKVSQRLYGTTRLWTELYLVNKDKLAAGYDNIPSGVELEYYEYQPAINNAQAVASVTPVEPAPVVEPSKVEKLPEPVDAAAPVVAGSMDSEPEPLSPAPPPVAPIDPIPETPVVAAVPPPAAPPQDYEPKELKSSSELAAGASSINVRRVLYVVLILVIGLVTFLMTRPKKKNFDMVQATTQETNSRNKLQDKDSQTKDVG